MYSSQEWWSNPAAGGGGGADPGDPIGQSLRVRRESHTGYTRPLQRSLGSAGSEPFTMSYWVKVSLETSANPHWSPSTAASGFRHSSSSGKISEVINNSNTWQSTGTYRDQSAWYHFVISNGPTHGKRVWVNGVQDNGNNSLRRSYTFSPLIIGNLVASSAGDWCFTGYYADWHFVNGQELDPTTFGRYNANGVWVPVNPKKDGDTAWYGANGFHLTFADPTDVGKDYSGNGNDFTATGFDTVSNFVREGTLYTETGVVQQQAFDNSNPIGALPTKPTADQNESNFMTTIELPSAVNSVSVDFGNPTMGNVISNFLLSADGTENSWTAYAPSPTASFPLTFYQETPFKYIRFVVTPSGGVWTWTLAQMLVTLPAASSTFDIMEDSPTNNYATLNPLITAGTPTNANLTTTTNFNGMGQTVGVSSGKWYGEVTCTVTPTTNYTYLQLGYCAGWRFSSIAQYTNTSYMSVTLTSAVASGNVSDNANINLSADYTGPAGAYGAVAGDVYSWTIDLDVGTWTIFKNNVEVGKFENISWDGFAAFSVQVHNQGAAGTWNYNNGQQPFRYTPPAGFEPLSTANMPAPTIDNGRDHFQVITSNGYSYSNDLHTTSKTSPDFTYNGTNWLSGVYPRACFDGDLNTDGASWTTEELLYWRPEGGFPNVTKIEIYGATTEVQDYWINGVKTAGPIGTNKTWHTVYDGAAFNLETFGVSHLPAAPAGTGWAGLRINGALLVDQGILEQAQQAFPSGLWWIKDRVNDNQHQLVDSVRGQDADNDWLALTCPLVDQEYKYSPPTGDSVAWCWNYNAANPTINGFQIQTYTGNGTARTINTNLGGEPEFIITKSMDNASYWCVYHRDATNPAGYLYLNTASLPTITNVYTGVTGSGYSISDNIQVNTSGNEYVSYAWTSVPGYSAFGSYTGNNNADGPFVYTGFRPAFVLVKCTTYEFPWSIFDSTRDVSNPLTHKLYPDGTGPENKAPNGNDFVNIVDFLSNGFKLRSDYANTNSARPYIYAAFAENPFQSPANAR